MVLMTWNAWLMGVVPVLCIIFGVFIGSWDERKNRRPHKVGRMICVKDEDGDYFMLQFYSDEDLKVAKRSDEVLVDVSRIN